jgi:ribosomal protein L21E
VKDKIRVIKENCDLSAAKDKSLPLDSYIVKYDNGDKVCIDIAQGMQVDIFDYYYDRYGNLISMKWTEGTVNPKLYNENQKKKKK